MRKLLAPTTRRRRSWAAASYRRVGTRRHDPPVLRNFSLGADTVDVSAGPQSVSFTAHVTDDLAGLSYGCMAFVSPSSLHHVSGCVNAGTLLTGDKWDGRASKHDRSPAVHRGRRLPPLLRRLRRPHRQTSNGTPSRSSPPWASHHHPRHIRVQTWGRRFYGTSASVPTPSMSAPVRSRSRSTAHVTDDLAGLSYGCMAFVSPSSLHHVSGCVNAGTLLTAISGTASIKARSQSRSTSRPASTTSTTPTSSTSSATSNGTPSRSSPPWGSPPRSQSHRTPPTQRLLCWLASLWMR